MVKARVARYKNVPRHIGVSFGIASLGFFGMIGILKYLENMPVAFAQSFDDNDASDGTPITNQSQEKKTESNAPSRPAQPPSANSVSSGPLSSQPVQTSAMVSGESVQVFEQFSGNGLDTTLWEVMSLPKAYRNNEEQLYDPRNVNVSDGMLRINAQRGADGQWRSGEVHSKWRYTYGDFEVRLATSTVGQGVWPAAWLLGEGKGWPNAGEVDIFESINSDPMAFSTIHGGGSTGHWMSQKYLWGYRATDFHTYRISKRPGIISWWVDGVKIKEWTRDSLSAGQVWPFEQHSNMGILNLAIGGSWPGPSNSTTPDSIILMVDYFKVSNAS